MRRWTNLGHETHNILHSSPLQPTEVVELPTCGQWYSVCARWICVDDETVNFHRGRRVCSEWWCNNQPTNPIPSRARIAFHLVRVEDWRCVVGPIRYAPGVLARVPPESHSWRSWTWRPDEASFRASDRNVRSTVNWYGSHSHVVNAGDWSSNTESTIVTKGVLDRITVLPRNHAVSLTLASRLWSLQIALYRVTIV